MFMNMMIIVIWAVTIVIISVGLWIKEKLIERKKEKAREKLWLL